MKQRYAPELFHKISLEKISEAELDILKESLVQPFKIVNSSLIRARVFETEKSGYLFLDVHHMVFDGTSSKVFFANVLRAYAGQNMEPDYYYYILSVREKIAASDYYLESKNYFETKYEGEDWCKHPSTDRKTRENKDDELYVMLPVTMEQLETIEGKYGVSHNAFFITAALLTTAIYEKKPNILISWIYNGRNNVDEMSSVGLLFRNLPVGIRLSKEMNLKELYSQVTEQIKGGITHRTKIQAKTMLGVCYNGSSEMVSNLAAGVTALLMNRLAYRFYQEVGVSVVSVFLYVQFIIMAVFMGMTTSVEPLFSYHYGSGNIHMRKKLFRLTMFWTGAFSLLLTVLLWLLNHSIVGIFFQPAGDSAPFFQLACRCLYFSVPACLFVGFNIFASGLFTAFSNGTVSASLSGIRTFLILSVCMLLLSRFFGADGLWAAWAVSEAISLLIGILAMWKFRKKYQYI
ncbi:MAG: condensation domain-containing protein [Clostridia bacterium]|nr:condensation domain-containing protein [Clostridia bacterium]